MLVHPAARPTPTYAPRPRATDLLYQTLQQHLATFLEQAREHDRPVPGHVERELLSYLACGIPAHGFALLRCDECDGSHVVPFSCKGRGFCPSCGGRWMSQTAAHLVDRVFPEVPVRQWVLTLPMPLRFWLARRPQLCREVLAVFLRAVFGWYRKRARGAGVAGGRCGAVTFVQSFGSSLNLNVHFHALVTDGVFAWDPRAGEPAFHPVRGLSTDDVEELVEGIRHRILRLLERKGLLEDANLDHDDGDGQVLMQAASAAGRVAMGRRAGRRARCLRGLPGSPYRRPERCAQSGWFNLHANVRIAARDRAGLERLCRYVARPPLAHGRLEERGDGQLVVRFKRPWEDGTCGLLLSPLEMIERLAALVPSPRAHRVHYHGVFAPAASWRRAIVPIPRARERRCLRPKGSGAARTSRWYPWADLLWRVFGTDPLRCPKCGRVMRVHAVVRGAWATHHVLFSLALPVDPPSLWPARASPAAA